MGLFDGVKEAFAAPARTTIIDAERETPIDRWMGWSVTKDKDTDANAIMTPQARTYIRHIWIWDRVFHSMKNVSYPF